MTTKIIPAKAPLLILKELASDPDAPAAVSTLLPDELGAPGALYSDPALDGDAAARTTSVEVA
jgi:hypothetical protein